MTFKRFRMAAAVVFGLLLVLPAVLTLVLPDRYVSERENRTLAQRPKLSAEALLSGKYMEELESYLSDQMLLRDGLTSFSAMASYALGTREFSGFYVGAGRLLQAQQDLDFGRLQTNLNYIEAFAQKVDLPVTLLPVPGSAEIYPETLPYGGRDTDLVPYYAAAQDHSFTTIDVRETLLSHKAEDIYFKTDHHWTGLGAHYAWDAYAAQAGIDATPLSAYAPQLLSDRFRGTGWAAVGLPGLPWDEIWAYDGGRELLVTMNRTEKGRMLYAEHLNTRDQYAAFLNGNQPLVSIEGGSQNVRKILIVKDSFANCLAQFAATDVERLDLIDLRFFHEDVAAYAREMGATELLFVYSMKNLCEDRNLYVLGR